MNPLRQCSWEVEKEICISSTDFFCGCNLVIFYDGTLEEWKEKAIRNEEKKYHR